MQESIADFALKLAEAKSDYAEVYLEESTGRSFAVEQGYVNGGSYGKSTGLRIRLLKNSKLYTFSTNVLDKQKIASAISRINFSATFDYGLSEERAEKADYAVKEAKKIEDADMLGDLLYLDRLLAKEKEIKYRSLYGVLSSTRSYYANSQGSEIRARIPYVNSFFRVVVGSGKETRARYRQFGGVGGYELFNTEKIGDELVEEARNLSKVTEQGVSLSKSALKKIKNVVISSEISGIAVHESVGHPSEADRVFGREAAQAGTSYLAHNLGMRIGSEQVNIVDDPTIAHAFGFYLYDDEGVKARPKKLVEKGVQKELLLNREYAYMLNARSNGSARSDSYSNEPIIRMSNTYLEKGDASFEELLAEAETGIYVKSFTEWNIDDTRSFARYQGNEAYLIRKGELSTPVKNFVIEKTTSEFWSAVRLVGKDFRLWLGICGKGEPEQGVPVTMGGSSALLSFG
ncbi:MAG: TldD/PmbA family protein [Candidatus Micrarchaeia archaeon]